MVTKLGKIPLFSVCVRVFGPDRAQNTIGHDSARGTNQKKLDSCAKCVSTKQKIVHGGGSSKTNLVIFVCSFEVCRVS